MSIKITQSSDEAAYIEVGDVIVYVENSSAAPECIHIWKNTKEELFKNNA